MAELRHIRTRGIIIQKHPFGENDFSVTIYSPDLGKIRATAKGGRKITSGFAGHIESLNLCTFQLYKSPVRYTIVQCQAEDHFKKIREDFDRTMVAGLIMEIFNKSTLSTEHSNELFGLLEESLRKLEESEQHFLTVESFKLNLLNHIGALPDLQNCFSCHERWNNGREIWLEPSGHLKCEECCRQETHKKTDRKNIQFGIIKLINYLTQPPRMQDKKISFSPKQKEELEHITRFFLQHFLDREILGEKMVAL